jgi:nucleoid DNA-binding protein
MTTQVCISFEKTWFWIRSRNWYIRIVVGFRVGNAQLRNFSRSSKSQSKYFGPEKFDDEYFNFNEALKNQARIHYITISKQEIAEKVFDKAVDDTLRLVKQHIERSNYNITSTFLLGGFGNLPYLQKKLRKKGKEFQTGEIILDSQGESAVMRGALIYGASLS